MFVVEIGEPRIERWSICVVSVPPWLFLMKSCMFCTFWNFTKRRFTGTPSKSFWVILSNKTKILSVFGFEWSEKVLLYLLHRRVALRCIKIQGPRLVDENFDVLGPFVLWGFDFDGVDFDSLIEGNVDDQLEKYVVNFNSQVDLNLKPHLFVTVRFKKTSCTGETVSKRVVIWFIHAFALLLHDECV